MKTIEVIIDIEEDFTRSERTYHFRLRHLASGKEISITVDGPEMDSGKAELLMAEARRKLDEMVAQASK